MRKSFYDVARGLKRAAFQVGVFKSAF